MIVRVDEYSETTPQIKQFVLKFIIDDNYENMTQKSWLCLTCNKSVHRSCHQLSMTRTNGSFVWNSLILTI